MAKASNIAVTDLSKDDSLVLTIDGLEYDIAQFIATFPLNGIPQATCMLAVGRNARDVEEFATIHETAATLKTMLPAKVTFKAVGDFDTNGKQWPEEGVVIFEGYFMGFSFSKDRGKITVEASLIHWLVDLGFSSTFSSILQPPQLGTMAYAAVIELLGNSSLQQGAGATGPAVFVPEHISFGTLKADVAVDLWSGIKKFLCALAAKDGYKPTRATGCLGSINLSENKRAQRALTRFEGPSGDDCTKAYRYAKPLPLITGGVGAVVEDAVSTYASNAMLSNFVSQTFWDVLVGEYGTSFNLDIVPMIDRALVVGSVHAPRLDEYWRTLKPEDYVFIGTRSLIPKPLRAVAMLSRTSSDTGFRYTEQGAGGPLDFGGCFGSNAVEDADGSLMIVAAPPWLENVPVIGRAAAISSGAIGKKPIKTATTPEGGKGSKPEDPVGSVTYDPVNQLMNRYAQSVFANNMLRGRTGEISGRLRFDIAPGSHLKIEGSPEQFLGAEDSLAATMYARVSRVTIEINAESAKAATSFGLMAIRSETENQDDRTSVDRHPLFEEGSIVAGAPMTEALEMADEASSLGQIDLAGPGTAGDLA